MSPGGGDSVSAGATLEETADVGCGAALEGAADAGCDNQRVT